MKAQLTGAGDVVRGANTRVGHEGGATPWFPGGRFTPVRPTAIPIRSIETVGGSMLVAQFVGPKTYRPRISGRAENSRRGHPFRTIANSAPGRDSAASRAQDMADVEVRSADLRVEISRDFIEHRALAAVRVRVVSGIAGHAAAGGGVIGGVDNLRRAD